MLGSRKEKVLDFNEDNKDADGELDLVQKLDNLDCMTAWVSGLDIVVFLFYIYDILKS